MMAGGISLIWIIMILLVLFSSLISTAALAVSILILVKLGKMKKEE